MSVAYIVVFVRLRRDVHADHVMGGRDRIGAGRVVAFGPDKAESLIQQGLAEVIQASHDVADDAIFSPRDYRTAALNTFKKAGGRTALVPSAPFIYLTAEEAPPLPPTKHMDAFPAPALVSARPRYFDGPAIDLT